jgi:curved DNA-binding protein CbpA
MTDYFAILGQPRRPWLEAELIKTAFHRASAILHPDVPGSGDAARFAELNAAQTILREPATRLRHLLELVAPENVAVPASPPAELGDLFMQIASIRQRLEALKKRQGAATSPLSRALLAGDEGTVRRELEAVVGLLEAAEAAALDEVREIDRSWDEQASAAAAALGQIYRRLSYLTRWAAQIKESLFNLG